MPNILGIEQPIVARQHVLLNPPAAKHQFVAPDLLAAERGAGVGHHVALSVVGSDRLPWSGYLRAKVAQEKLIADSGQPYSIVRATQFYEFAGRIADEATVDGTARLSTGLMQPIAAADVSAAVARVCGRSSSRAPRSSCRTASLPTSARASAARGRTRSLPWRISQPSGGTACPRPTSNGSSGR